MAIFNIQLFCIGMKTNSMTHLQTVRNFKTSIMSAVEAHKFDEEALQGLLRDVFGRDRVEVFYDNDYLAKGSLGASHVYSDVHNFIFREEPFDEMRGMDLTQLRQGGMLEAFSDFYGQIVHEFSHGVYKKQSPVRREKIYKNLEESLKDKKHAKKLGDVIFGISQKTIFDYSRPEQLVQKIQGVAEKFSSNPTNFAENIHRAVMDHLHDESIAYVEGCRAQRDIMGKKIKFFSIQISFPEVKDYFGGAYNMAKDAFRKKN